MCDTVTSVPTTSVSPHAWEESTGLLSQLIPQSAGTTTWTNPQAFNSSRGDLKLGPAPVNEELRVEAERLMREQAMVERDPSASYDAPFLQPSVPGLMSPATTELPPHPPSFRTIDVRREVEKVRDARKRIRLEPSALAGVDLESAQGTALRSRALPSVCMYTLHDVGEG
jgi:transcription initiation factor TFIID subunit 5